MNSMVTLLAAADPTGGFHWIDWAVIGAYFLILLAITMSQRGSLYYSRVRHAVGRLTEEQQQVLVLRFFEELSTGEVAQIMGKRRGAIRGLQFRALSALRDLLYREQDEVA